MAEAKRDKNYVTTLIVVSADDLVTPVRLSADATLNRLLTSGLLQAFDSGGTLRNLTAVESVDEPGTFGLVVLNPDGTALSTGGGSTPTTDGYWNSTNDTWDSTTVNWDQT